MNGDSLYSVPPDYALENRFVQVEQVGSGTTSSFITNHNGYVDIALDTGLYAISYIPFVGEVAVLPADTIQIASINSFQYLKMPVNIATPIRDLSTDIEVYTLPRPGFENIYLIRLSNLSDTTIYDVEFSYTFAPLQTITSISGSLGPYTTLSNTVTWTIDSLVPFEQLGAHVRLQTSVLAPLGGILSHQTIASALVPDVNQSNDTAVVKVVVVGSYDPNDKLVNPSELTPQNLLDGTSLDYRIRFQNTGTYLAENVRIEDQLPLELDENTFEFVGSSHPCTWTNNNGNLTFYFNNIQLPDSNTNEPASHGFVEFRITPASSLLVGDTISNSAAIYFDFNAPVITDPVDVEITTTTAIANEQRNRINLLVWPNPNDGSFSIEFSPQSELGILEIYSSSGKMLHQEQVAAWSQLKEINNLDLSSGLYQCTLRFNEQKASLRFVVE